MIAVAISNGRMVAFNAKRFLCVMSSLCCQILLPSSRSGVRSEIHVPLNVQLVIDVVHSLYRID